MELPKSLIAQVSEETIKGVQLRNRNEPLFWIKKTNKGFEAVRIKFMDTKYIHTAIRLVKDNTKKSDDLFGEFTRLEWLKALTSELDERDLISSKILSQFKGLNQDYRIKNPEKLNNILNKINNEQSKIKHSNRKP